MAEELPHEEQAPLPRGREAVDWWLKKWGRSEPLTREDVQHLIKVNGGTANELALSRRNLQDASLGDSNLRGARLWRTNLRHASLGYANLYGADLSYPESTDGRREDRGRG